MATYYGNTVAYGSASWFRVVVEVTDAGSNTGTATTVYYRYGVQFLYSISDSNNSVSWSDAWGSGSANNFNFSSSTGTTFWVTGMNANAAGIVYGGGTSVHFHMQASGLAGVLGTSSVDFDYGLPGRSATVPDQAPTPVVENITSNAATVRFPYWPSGNGLGLSDTGFWLFDAAGTTIATDNVGSAVSEFRFEGLARNTQYLTEIRAANAMGWGAASGRASFTTGATVPDAPPAPTISNITSTEATVTMSLPYDGGSPITDTGFLLFDSATGGTQLAADPTTTPVTSCTFSNLVPNTTYYAEVFAINVRGWGTRSIRTPFTTMSGARVKVSGSWLSTKAWVNVGGVWLVAQKVWKKHDGVWSI